MVEWVRGLFSSAPGLSRVNPVGLIVLAVGALTALFAGKLTKLFHKQEKGRFYLLTKLAGLVLTVIGFVIAIYTDH